jgi:hypothetical protein
MIDKVYLGTPTHGQPRFEYMAGIIKMREHEMAKGPDESLLIGMKLSCGAYIARNRNAIVRAAKKSAAALEVHPERLAVMMVDHDVYGPEDTMERMVRIMNEHEADVVTGDLPLGNSAPTTGFQLPTADRPMQFELAARPEGADVAWVECVATSCILVRMTLLDRIAAFRDDGPYYGLGTWFMHWPRRDPDTGEWAEFGEDFSFSIRATEVGARMLIAYDLDLTHHKITQIVPDEKTLDSIRNKGG